VGATNATGKSKKTNKSSKHSKQCVAQVECSEIDGDKMRELLKRNDLHYHMKPVGKTDVEASLKDHIRSDNLDEDNKFICAECTKKKGTNSFISNSSLQHYMHILCIYLCLLVN